jgi:hypothetical protein
VYDLSIGNTSNSIFGSGVIVPNASGMPSVLLVRVNVANCLGGGIANLGGNLTITDSTISDNPGGGIVCLSGTTTVTRSTVSNNFSAGISSDDGTLVVNQSDISNNRGEGISSTANTVTISQSTVSNNEDGGIELNQANYDISNTFIVKNGNPQGNFGGLSVVVINETTHRFEFNTLSSNISRNNSSGIFCDIASTQLIFANNIIYGDLLGSGPELSGDGAANCIIEYSDVGPTPIAGTGNINNDPQFANTASGDYHLQAGSPAENVADPSATTSVDFDGDSRPQGGRSDMGADEVKQ